MVAVEGAEGNLRTLDQEEEEEEAWLEVQAAEPCSCGLF